MQTTTLTPKAYAHLVIENSSAHIRYYVFDVLEENLVGSVIRGYDYFPLGMILQDDRLAEIFNPYILTEAEELWEKIKRD